MKSTKSHLRDRFVDLTIRVPEHYANYMKGHLQKEHPKTKGKITIEKD